MTVPENEGSGLSSSLLCYNIIHGQTVEDPISRCFVSYNIPTWLIVILFVVIGFASSAIVIGMAFVKESVPVPFAGTVSGISNMGMEMGPMILQPAIGCILDLKWNGSIARGIRIYDLNAYHTAFSLIIGLIISGIIIIHFARETFCRQLRQ
jgi:hypothetical protein